jgi:hypothetical protein
MNVLASFALSASNSYRLLPPSRCTTIRNAEDDDFPDWHETRLLMWYDDVLALSKTLAVLFVVGMIYIYPPTYNGKSERAPTRDLYAYAYMMRTWIYGPSSARVRSCFPTIIGIFLNTVYF